MCSRTVARGSFGPAGYFSEGMPFEAGDLVLGNRKDARVYRIRVLN